MIDMDRYELGKDMHSFTNYSGRPPETNMIAEGPPPSYLIEPSGEPEEEAALFPAKEWYALAPYHSSRGTAADAVLPLAQSDNRSRLECSGESGSFSGSHSIFEWGYRERGTVARFLVSDWDS